MQSWEKQFLDIENVDDEFILKCKQLKLSQIFYEIDQNTIQTQILYLIKSILKFKDFEDDIYNFQNISQIYMQNSFDQAYFISFYLLLGIFMKQNYLGKEFNYQNADKKVRIQNKIILNITKKQQPNIDFQQFCNQYNLPFQDLSNYNYRLIKSQDFQANENQKITDELSIHGEIFPRQIKGKYIFFTLIKMTKFLNQNSGLLWKARIHYMHDQLIEQQTQTNSELSIQNYQKFYIQNKNLDNKYFLSNFNVEYAHCLLFYYKYSQCKLHLEQAKKEIGLKLNLSGKLGVRTKYQTFQTAQLVLEAYDEEDKLKPEIIASENSNIQPLNCQFDDESILLEQPLLQDDDNQHHTKEDLNVYEQIIAQGSIRYFLKAQAQDEITKDYVKAYVELLIKKSCNWTVYSNTLLIRSLNEFDSIKRAERSLIQLDQLIQQFNDKNPDLYERFQFIFSCQYPNIMFIYKSLAEKYTSVGCVMSACQLYERLDMLEECVECLAMAQQFGEAKKRALEIKDFNTNPKLLCIYGELMKDISFFKKAWQVSNKKFVRAKRSLARYYFNIQEYEKSIRKYKKVYYLLY